MFANLSGVLQGWLGTPLRTGLIFWLGGLILWLLHIINWQAVNDLLHNHLANNDRLIQQEWLGIWDFLRNMQEPETLLILLIVVAIILLSGVVVKTLQFRLLRLLEGYGWPHRLRKSRVDYYEEQHKKKSARWEELDKKARTHAENLEYTRLDYEEQHQKKSARWEELNKKSRTHAENWEYTRLDKEVTYSPESNLRMPTRLGNILRSYEQRPRRKYGLDVIICWARLWLLLPKETQEELIAARAVLDEAIQIIAWGSLFLIWMIWNWWLALLIALLLIWGGYRLALHSADIYGQLLEATFDVHRHLLYQSLRWELPEDVTEEKQQGIALTRYLWRGTDDQKLKKHVPCDKSQLSQC